LAKQISTTPQKRLVEKVFLESQVWKNIPMTASLQSRNPLPPHNYLKPPPPNYPKPNDIGAVGAPSGYPAQQ